MGGALCPALYLLIAFLAAHSSDVRSACKGSQEVRSLVDKGVFPNGGIGVQIILIFFLRVLAGCVQGSQGLLGGVVYRTQTWKYTSSLVLRMPV